MFVTECSGLLASETSRDLVALVVFLNLQFCPALHVLAHAPGIVGKVGCQVSEIKLVSGSGWCCGLSFC